MPRAVVSLRASFLLLPLSIHVASIKYFVAVPVCLQRRDHREQESWLYYLLVHAVVVLHCVFLSDRMRKSLGHFVTRSWERAVGTGSRGEERKHKVTARTTVCVLFKLSCRTCSLDRQQPSFLPADFGAADYSDNTYPVAIESEKLSCRDDSFLVQVSGSEIPIHAITETSQM